jgi:acyl-CoA oxidase
LVGRLSSIQADRGWFADHGKMSAGRGKAIGAQINALCAELRPDALSLVEGFGIPESWLGEERTPPHSGWLRSERLPIPVG